MSVPKFAVVGHPNKGKSSLVATLARDPSVGIGPEPGTTVCARPYPMRLNGEVMYVLVDTPGFQRARAALDWMRRHEADAGSRAQVVARFIAEHAGEERFQDECELLRPIMEGAGIIYVVDGAAPYGPEYDAEMEILRWTGRPSLALINPIGQPRFVESWQAALRQFFSVVRVLDVMQARFDQQIELLRLFGHLVDDWRGRLDEAVAALLDDRRRQREDAAAAMAEMIGAALTHVETKDIGHDEDPQPHISPLEQRYRGRLRQLERQARAEVESIYGYTDLDRQESEFDLLEMDLLARETWLAFGLKRRDLVAIGAAGGAVAGGVIDVSLLGASFLAGSIVGGVIGGALGWIGSDKLGEVKVLHQPLGGKRLRYGPTKNLQFPFVLLGRALLHHRMVAIRTHAQRGRLELGSGTVQELPDTVKRQLAVHFDRIRRAPPATERHSTAVVLLGQLIASLMEPDESSSS
jgi:GTPase Era involved in 16S rRNA processing